uniref:Uncharacterized protein n=1 Tax=Anguilla anguilla TaxID=7936 RepID=A0A0E9WQ90_ANGAN
MPVYLLATLRLFSRSMQHRTARRHSSVHPLADRIDKFHGISKKPRPLSHSHWAIKLQGNGGNVTRSSLEHKLECGCNKVISIVNFV